MMAKKKAEAVEPKEVTDSNGADGSAKAVEVAMRALKKRFGDGVVDWFSDAPAVRSRTVIPTGSLGLDAALGVGGIVLGRLYELYGTNQSGKTTLAISIIREAIKQGRKAIWVDAERTLDDSLLEKMGVDRSKIVIIKAFTGEDNLDAAEALMATGEFSLCVIDSIGALQPASEANLETFSDNTMGVHPRLMSRMCRSFTPLADSTNTGLLLINQIRANLGYGAHEITPGGNALQHHLSGRIKVHGGGLKSKHIKNEHGDVIGHRVSFEITKNKLSMPFRTTEVDLLYGKGFDNVGEVLDYSVDMGLVDLSGAWYSYNGDKIGQGRPKTVAGLAENPELYGKLFADVSRILGIAPQ